MGQRNGRIKHSLYIYICMLLVWLVLSTVKKCSRCQKCTKNLRKTTDFQCDLITYISVVFKVNGFIDHKHTNKPAHALDVVSCIHPPMWGYIFTVQHTVLRDTI